MGPVCLRSGSTRRTFVAVALGLVACVVLTGCAGGAAKGNGSQVEVELARQLPDLDFREVTCPETPLLQKGTVFDCQAKSGNGASTVIKVSQPDEAGAMKFNIARNELMETAAAAAYLQGQLRNAGIDADVNCGNRIRMPVDEGTSLVCRAAEASGRSVNYTVVAHPTADDVEITVK